MVKGGFVSGGHIKVNVPVFTYGLSAWNFFGIYENTAIFEKIKSLMISRNNH